MKKNPIALAAIGAGIVLVLAYPLLFTNPYYVHLAETILIYAILLYGLDIVVGYTGQVSLGHAGLFGIGSYATGILVLKLGAPGSSRSRPASPSPRCSAPSWRCRRCA